MSTSDRSIPGPRQSTPKPVGATLAKRVGGLPIPPRLAKPPALRVTKPLGASPPRPALAKPRPDRPSKPNSDRAGRGTIAGQLGSFTPSGPVEGSRAVSHERHH